MAALRAFRWFSKNTTPERRQGARESKPHPASGLFQEPVLGNYYGASLHLILVHPSDEYVFHAKEAVRLYHGLYADANPENPPTEKQQASKDRLIAAAKKVLAKALADTLDYGGELDMEALQEDIDAGLVEVG